jgi:hypothetical protein
MVTLQFSSAADLNEFETTINVLLRNVDHVLLTLTASLNEQAIELAINGYNAQVL